MVSKNDAKEDFNFEVIDLESFLSKGKAHSIEDCKNVAKLLHELGVLIVKDPRVSYSENDKFIDMMEKYYNQPQELKDADIHPEYYYQVGATPNGIEKARNHCKLIKSMDEENKPVTECPPGADPKWRFFWRMGETPKETEFPGLNAAPVVPKAFPDWSNVMNKWGSLILDTIVTVAEMAALGFDLPADSFTKLMKYGPHLLAPTGSDLKEHGKLNTVFAKYHYDLNFLTIHGKSRYPGLFVWTRTGKRVMVKVPHNCLLIQAGKQFEYLTGGHVLAGYHEVVVAPATLKSIEKAKENNKSLWRVSSTLFGHIGSDNILQPLGHFENEETKKSYPAIKAGHQVQNELKAINLKTE